MDKYDNIKLQARLRVLSLFLMVTITLIACLTLLGWMFNIEYLKRPLPRQSAMNPMTAILFICSSISFFLISEIKGSPVRKNIGFGFAFFVIIMGVIRYISAFFNLNFYPDYLFFTEALKSEESMMLSTRMSLLTAFNFIISGAALLLLDYKSIKRRIPTQYIAFVITTSSLLGIIGYLYQVRAFHGELIYIPMAVSTAVCFLLFSLALLFIHPEEGLIKNFTTTLTGSITARLMIPFAIVIPIVLGYLRLLGYWYGVFGTEFGVAVLVLSIIICFLCFVSYVAGLLNRKDIARKEVESEVIESENMFSTLFYKSPIMKAIAEVPSGRYLEVNDAFMDFLGLRKEEMIGKTSTELNMLVRPEEREMIFISLNKFNFVRDVETQITSSDGKMKWVSTNIDLIELNGKKCFLTAAIDITTRKEIEEKLVMVNKELEAFSYSVSHDLRAPLRAVNGYAKMLEQEYSASFDEEGRRLLTIVQKNAQKMGALIDDLLRFARLGRNEIQKSPLQMVALTESALVEIGKSQPNNAEIKIHPLHNISADSSMISQAMINLLSNAIKYSSKRKHPVIEVNSSIIDGDVVYSVSDNGTGFEMAYVDKLFGVFQRLHSDEEYEGTGVGLALVKRIIDKHGGKVWATGELNKGATFYFSLPII
jgi:PAS domain S-box-containing protein